MTGRPENSPIVLTPMTPGRDVEFAQMLEEFRDAGEYHVYDGNFAVAWDGYAGFYDLLSRMKAGGYPRPDIVPMDSYFIESGGRILGEVYVRHRLSPWLEQIGGHVGYKVRPSARNQGVATAALRLALKELKALGVESALVTCNTTNAASAKVIERCGGQRIEDAILENRIERRYWVPTRADLPAARRR
ncbi:GNAT family N-acetyltransferase [Acidobacteria bacterium AB60]|nr:GNAT family N-acetyltransferase [Acidobacteria bacterium AB60]